jgi:hypothetical protein
MAGLDTGPAGSSGTTGGGPGDARVEAGRTIDSVKEQAGELAGRAADKGKSILSRQKESAASQLDSVAHALHGTARRLEDDHQDQAGRFVGFAADRIESLGTRLRTQELDTLVQDAQGLARRSPGAFFAGTVVAGFLLSRFLKASADHRGSGHRPDRPPDLGPSDEAYAAPEVGGRQERDLRSGVLGSAGDFPDEPGRTRSAPVGTSTVGTPGTSPMGAAGSMSTGRPTGSSTGSTGAAGLGSTGPTGASTLTSTGPTGAGTKTANPNGTSGAPGPRGGAGSGSTTGGNHGR